MFYIDDFLNHLKAKNYNQKNTIKAYHLILNEFSCFCDERNIYSVKQLTENNVIGYLECIKEKGISDRYFYLKLYRLRIYFNFLYEEGYIFFAFLKDYIFPKYLRNNFPVLAQTEIKNILEAIKVKDTLCSKGKTILELMYSSALRPSEVCKLKIFDIDFKEKQLFIQQSKCKKDRIVPIGKIALDLITEYIHNTRRRYLKSHSPGNIFLSLKSGLPHNSYGIRWVIRETLKRSGFNPIKPYSLRATSATVLFLNGMGIAHINKLLGHADFTTTRIYLRVNEMNLKNVLGKHHPRIKLNIKEAINDI